MKRSCLLLLVSLVLPAAAFAAPASSAAQLRAEFDNSWDYYRKTVTGGSGIDERLKTLDRIIVKYRGKHLDARLSCATSEKAYLLSWKFYRKRMDLGAGLAERRQILERIRTKYKDTVADLSLVDRELASLEAPPPPSTEPAPAPAVDVSTVTAVAEPAPVPASEPTPETATPARTYKRAGIGLGVLGTSGLYGFHAVYNHTDLLSFSVESGSNNLLVKKPNSDSSASHSSQTLFVRYGRNVYAAAGFMMHRSAGELSAGSTRTSASVTNYAVPLIIGAETGNKRGLFFSVELAYVPYFGGGGKTLTGVDPESGDELKLEVGAPASGATFGFKLGWYLF